MKEAIIKHLQDRREQLRALILNLEDRGEEHPQYSQLEFLKHEHQIVINQLQKLEKLN